MTGITSNRLPSSLASFAADSHETLIISGSRKPGRSVAKSAMNSQFLCAQDTIARSTVAGTKANGGGQLGLIRWLPLALYGWNVIHCRSRATQSLRAMADAPSARLAGIAGRPKSTARSWRSARRRAPARVLSLALAPNYSPSAEIFSLLREVHFEIARREGELPPRWIFRRGPSQNRQNHFGRGPAAIKASARRRGEREV